MVKFGTAVCCSGKGGGDGNWLEEGTDQLLKLVEMFFVSTVVIYCIPLLKFITWGSYKGVNGLEKNTIKIHFFTHLRAVHYGMQFLPHIIVTWSAL